MSFDIYVQDIPMDVVTADDIPDNFEAQPLGPRSIILAAIAAAAPDVQWPEAGTGTIRGYNYTIEIDLGKDDPVEEFAFFVRGSGDGLVVIAHILEALGLRAIAPDCDGGIFELNNAALAFDRWRMSGDPVPN